MSSPAFAKPWWWNQFTIGGNNGTGTLNTPYSRWVTFPIAQASTANNNDTVVITSFTWSGGAANIGPVDGINGGNTAGVNWLYTARAGAGNRNVHTISDDDASYPPPSLIAGPSQITDAPNTRTSHNKLVFVGNVGLMFMSGNMSNAGMDAQPNNAIWFRWSQMTPLCKEYEKELNEQLAGTFHDNTPHSSYTFFSPNRDTVELYFAPDDNGNIPAGDIEGQADPGTAKGWDPAHASDKNIKAVLCRLIRNAKESVFACWNNFTDAQFSNKSLEDHLENAKGTLFVEGVYDSLGAGMLARLQANHGASDWNTLTTGEMHHKFTVIDQEIVATGSANHTGAAMAFNNGNDENEMVIHDFRLARRYMRQYRKVNAQITTRPPLDSFEQTKPAGATALTVAATDTAFYPSWTASASSDVTRYFLFIDSAAITTQAQIGDGIDNDGDGYIDEDPRGDADGFPSGTTKASATANDDDADGSIDEDLWMWPEVQKKGRSSTSTAITTYNVGDTLLPATNYWFAIVSVDTHGNEGTLATFGPVQLTAGGAVADTKLVVQLNSTIADSNARLGDSRVVAANIFIQGETGALQDTLTLFAVKNLGTTDSRDMTVRLWRDEDSNRLISAVDTMLAQLIYSNVTKRYEAAFVASDSRVRLGAAGKAFLIALDIFDTAGIGDTFQAQIDIRTCSSSRRDSGPISTVTNPGKITIIGVDTAPPNAFALTAPPDLTETRASTITLRWADAVDDSSPPVYYEVQIDTAGTFISNVLDTTGLFETFVVVVLSVNDTYSWRVIARDNQGNARNSSSTRRIVVDTAPPVTGALIAPTNLTDTTLTTIVFRWNAASDTGSGVNGYRLQIDTTNTFVAPFVDSATTLLSGTRTLPANDTYFWRIVAVDDAGNTRAVAANRLRIDTVGPVVGVLSNPAANFDTKSKTIKFSWTAAFDAITGESGYRLQIDTTNTFTTFVVDSATTLLTLTQTLLVNDTYFWRVVALDSIGNTSVYPSRRLRIDTTIPPPVLLITKHGDTFTNAVSLEWVASADSISGLAFYVVQVDTLGTFATATLKDSATHFAGDTIHLFGLPISDTYFWRVLAYDSAGNFSTSLPLLDSFITFITDTTPPNAFNLTAPADLTETRFTTILLQWQDAIDTGSNPVRYRVQIDKLGTFAAPYFDSSGLLDTFISAPFRVNDTSSWRVIATDNSGNTVVVNASRRIVVDTTGPVVGALIAPSSPTDTRATTITFRWNAASDTGTGVNGYRLQIDTTNTFVAPFIDSSAGLSLAGTRTLPANDTYFWRVISVDDAGNTTAVASNLIRVDTSPPLAGVLSAPTSPLDTTSTTIAFAWTTAVDTGTGIAGYRLQIDTASTFAAPFIDSAAGLLLAGTRTLPANDSYYWRVVAIDNAGNTVAYPASLIRIDTAGPTAPGSTLPVDLMDTTNTRPTFRWTASSDTGIGNVTYRLQIDVDNQFISNVVDTMTTALSLIVELPANVQYFWRVIAIDSFGNATPNASRSFRIDTEPPTQVLLDTFNGDSTSPPVTLTWSLATDGVTFVAFYVVQIDTSGTFTSLVESDTMIHPDTDVVSGIVQTDTYFWRVIAYDAVGNFSISATDSFVLARNDTVPPSAFGLTLPADNSLMTSTSIAFQWANSLDDTSPPVVYNLQIDTGGVFTVNVIDTSWLIDTFVTVKLSANDTYYWRVIARDNELNTTVSSTIYLFSIDTAPPSAPALTTYNGAQVLSSAYLTWSPAFDSISGVKSYLIQIDNSSSFTTPLIDSVTQSPPDTDYFTALLAPDTYFWRVFAYDTLGNSAVSSPIFDSFVVSALDTTAPLFLAVSASPSSVSNSGPTTVTFTIFTSDSAYVSAVLFNLLPIGQSDSTPATPNTAVPSTDTMWTLSVIFDSNIVGGIYDLVVLTLDASLNSTTTTVRVTVTDVTPSFAQLVDTPLANIRAAGNELSVVSSYGDSYARVLYEFRSVVPLSGWMTCTSSRSLSNPDTTAPFWGFFWDISSLVSGAAYDVRAVGTDKSGVTDPSPGFVRVTIDNVDSNVNEYRVSATSNHIRRQRIFPDTYAMMMIADGTALTLPAGAVTETVWIRITEFDAVPATAPVSAGLAIAGAPVFREFIREDGRRTFPKKLTLTLPYGDTDALDDNIGTTKFRESSAAIYHFDEVLKVWVWEPTSKVDPVKNVVTATVDHFTQFAVLVGLAAEPNLSNVVIYPNPFVPYDNNDRNGKPFSVADPTSGIIFDSLPLQVSVEIFNANGRRVATFAKTSADARFHWDAFSDDNRELASGMYIAVIKSSTGEQVVKKILIVR